jgi:hypothetical protein
MSLIIPNTFADKSTDLQLSSLDDNFTYLATQINLVNTNVNQLSTALTLGNWNITESGGSLLFKHNGINKMKLDTLGNLSVTGDLIAYETL